jgi:hypothetical protein
VVVGYTGPSGNQSDEMVGIYAARAERKKRKGGEDKR